MAARAREPGPPVVDGLLIGLVVRAHDDTQRRAIDVRQPVDRRARVYRDRRARVEARELVRSQRTDAQPRVVPPRLLEAVERMADRSGRDLERTVPSVTVG